MPDHGMVARATADVVPGVLTHRERVPAQSGAMKTVTFLVVTLSITLPCAACKPRAATVAERCVLIGLQQERGRELIPLLEAFAAANNLKPERSHPVAPRYQRSANGELQAEIAYTMGMGELGADLSLFRFDENASFDLLVAFDAFVNDLRNRYSVTACEDRYPSAPVVYR